jgi:fibronectin type 3 domain-containing protein
MTERRVVAALLFSLVFAAAASAAPGQFTITNPQQVCSGNPNFLVPSLRFTWTVSSGATSYRVERNGVTVASSLQATSYEDFNVTPDQQYTYTVFASDASGETQSANSVTLTAPHCTPPDRPTLTATSICESARAAVQLSWNAVPRATTYDVFRNGIKIRSNLSGNTTSTVDTNVTAGTTYSYFVRAENLATSTGPDDPPTSPGDSQTVTLQVTNVCPPPPAAPSVSTSATCAGTDPSLKIPKVTVTWTAPAGATSYQVSRDNAPAAMFPINTTGTTFEDTNVTAGTTYTYTIIAFGEGGGSQPGTSTITVPQNICATPPAAPVVQQVSNICSAETLPLVRLEWNAAAHAASYTVLRNNTAIATNVTNTVYFDSPALGGTYTYVVRAVNADGTADSAPATITHTDPCPRPPGSFTASTALFCSSTNNETGVRVTWTASSGAASYAVLRNGTMIASGLTGTSYDDNAVNDGSAYSYTVEATNSAGTSSASTGFITVVDICPHPPGAFGLTGRSFCSASSAAVFLSWSVSSGVVSYTVLRNNVAIANGLTSLDYEDSAVTPGTTYTYVVRALNANGSTDSNPVQVTPTECNTSTPRADLSVSNVTLSQSSAGAGDIVNVTYTIANNGDAAAAETQTRIFIGDTLVLGVASPPLAAGATRTESHQITVPSSITPGPHSVTVAVNDDRTVDESTFANNVSAGAPITITGPACEPNCLVTAPVRATVGRTILFSLAEPPSCDANVQWQFGNGTLGAGESAAATYTAAGVYNWTVIVTVNGQPSCTNTGTITVTTTPPVTKRRPARRR